MLRRYRVVFGPTKSYFHNSLKRFYVVDSTMLEAFAPSSSDSVQKIHESQNTTIETPKSGQAKNESSLSILFGTSQLNDTPISNTSGDGINWSDSFHGLGICSFSNESSNILCQPISNEDVEITPDGLLYLPEIKYRRILNKAFGPGGWGLAPRSETLINKSKFGGGTLTREYALIVQGRLVSIARGEQDFFSEKGIPTATEGCKSNALMRCCKDLGVASELWDPRFIRSFKKSTCEEVFVEHVTTKKKKKIWKRRDGLIEYPFKK